MGQITAKGMRKERNGDADKGVSGTCDADKGR